MDTKQNTEWTVENIDDSGPWFYYDDAGKCVRVPGYWVRGPQSLGNMESAAFTREDATLMAAAPKLLDMLRKSEWMGDEDEDWCWSCRQHRHDGHAKTCQLALALAAVSPPAAGAAEGGADDR